MNYVRSVFHVFSGAWNNSLPNSLEFNVTLLTSLYVLFKEFHQKFGMTVSESY